MFYNKQHKYGAKKTVIDGIKFDSKLEARFYKYFKDHNIEILELQPTFILQDKFRYEGKMIRAIKYIADFKINYNGDIYIVDAKGMSTPVFEIKKKMWIRKYGDENILLIVKSFRDFEAKTK